MNNFLSSIAVMVVLLLLGSSGIVHMRRWLLPYAIQSHGVIRSPGLSRLMARSAVGVEVLTGVLGLAGILFSPDLLRFAMLGGALYMAVLFAYLSLVLIRAPGAEIECGCGIGEHRLGSVTLLRIVFLGALTVWAAASEPRIADLSAPEGLVSVSAGIAVAILVALLPALRDLSFSNGAANRAVLA